MRLAQAAEGNWQPTAQPAAEVDIAKLEISARKQQRDPQADITETIFLPQQALSLDLHRRQQISERGCIQDVAAEDLQAAHRSSYSHTLSFSLSLSPR